FKEEDYIELRTAACRALDPTLSVLLKENKIYEADLVLKLVKLFITNIDDLACLLLSEQQIDNVSPVILSRLKHKLECRGKLLTLGFTNEKTLLDKITTNYSTLNSFKSMTYKQLSEYCRQITHDNHAEILKNLWIKDNDLHMKIQKYSLPLGIVDQFLKHNICTADLTEQNMQLIISDFTAETNDKDDK
ncbi:unnamed protein product, partial [Didymodactylos carnosus]